MLDFDKNAKCVGCTACSSSCPVNAITMVQSSRGFYIPQINKELCIGCGACERSCVAMNEHRDSFDTPVYMNAFSLDEGNRSEATSGGIFYHLASDVINRGGLVCGCIWDEHFKAKHILTSNTDDVMKMKGSKYVQSDMGNCFKEIKEALKSWPVLFVGTPCQTTALHNYIKNDQNLYLCSVVCGGVPSPLVWGKYLASMELKMGSKVTDVKHRSKRNGWLCLTVEVGFENGKRIYDPMVLNKYARAFFSGLIINEACIDCPCRWGDFYSDLIVADGWGLDSALLKKSKNRGVSAVVLLTGKGSFLFNNIKDKCYINESTKECFEKGHAPIFHAKKKCSERDVFFSELERRDILENLKSCTPKRRHARMNNFLRQLGIYPAVYTLLYKIRH